MRRAFARLILTQREGAHEMDQNEGCGAIRAREAWPRDSEVAGARCDAGLTTTNKASFAGNPSRQQLVCLIVTKALGIAQERRRLIVRRNRQVRIKQPHLAATASNGSHVG